jgi:gliding motility-associated lipoprotein GldH
MKRQNFSTVVILILVSILLCGCGGSHKEKTILEHKHVFPEQKWNRFQEFKHQVDIKDTETLYGISLEVVCTPDIQTDNIPIVFSIYSPGGGEAHTLSTIYLNEKSSFTGDENTSSDRIILHTIYPARSFTEEGTYTLKFYQKVPKYDLIGVKSVKIRMYTVPE